MSLNATPASPDANSYVTEREAGAYFLNRAHAELWEVFEERAQILMTASQMLDWYINWKGYKASTVQAMKWPRVNVVRRDGSPVPSDTIPKEVKIAVYELALASLEGDRTVDNPMAGIEQVKAGSLMVKADRGDFDSTVADTIPERVWKILSDLYSRGNISVVRLMRA